MKLTILDAGTLGEDICLQPLQEAGDLTVFAETAQEKIEARICNADVVITNKLKLNRENLKNAANLKLICVTATGFDNIDLDFCRERGIGVCNVPGYSTDSVAQATLAMVLELSTHLSQYRDHVRSGAYSRGGCANYLGFPWSELAGTTWGVIGGGAIGQRVAAIAQAFGCRVLMCRRKQDPHFQTVDLDTLCRESDVITVHVPLNPQTRGMLDAEQIARMKTGAILVNTARGAVCDEAALTEAIISGHLGGLGIDVYVQEPLAENHPYFQIVDRPDVCLTPHMAWSAREARNRCVAEVAGNIRAFAQGDFRNRIV